MVLPNLKAQRKLIISIIVTAVIGIFYFNQELYLLKFHNDFAEYFVRAELWAEGVFAWIYGSDKLLSVIEYFAIKISSGSDFSEIYTKINNIITILALLSIYLFLTNKNKFAIKFNVRILTIIFVFSLPLFIIKARLADPTYLFGIMLLIWISTYHIKIISPIVSFLVIISRPEGVIIIPLFLLVLLLDENNRKKASVNFIFFLLIFCVYKLFDSFYTPSTHAESLIAMKAYERYSEVSFINNSLLKIIINFILIPVNYFLFAIIILKSYLFFSFFVIGTFISLKDKKYYPYFAVPILYLLMIFVISSHVGYSYYSLDWIKSYILSNTSWIVPYGHISPVFPSDFHTLYYKILESHAKLPIINEGRYLMFLYPFFSVFVVVGIFFTVERIASIVSKHKFFPSKKILTIVLVGGCIYIFLLVNIIQFIYLKNKFNLESITNHLVPLNHVALYLRKYRNSLSDSILIYDNCNSLSRKKTFFNNMVAEFTSFSGILNVYINTCDAGALVKGSDRTPILDRATIPGAVFFETRQELAEINERLNFRFDNFAIDYKYNIANKLKINKLFQSPTLHLFKKLSIDFVIVKSNVFINTAVLKDLKQLSIVKGYKIYSIQQ